MPFQSRISVVGTSLGPVEVRRIGRGLPILYFHGGQSDARNTTYDHIFDLDRYELIVPSRPGYGRTPLGHNQAAADTARLIDALAGALELPAAAVIGVSLGARPAIAFAALFPARTRSLVLSAPITGRWLTREDPRWYPAHMAYNPVVERGVWAMTRMAFSVAPHLAAQRFVRGISTGSPGPVANDDIANLQARVRTYRSRRGFLADLHQSLDDDCLRHVQSPTLIQHSLHDASVDVSQSKAAASLIPNARLRLYDNAFGHFLWLGPGSAEVEADAREFIEATIAPDALAAE